MLSPLSSIYAKISDLRNARFDSGKSKSFDLGARTISVGNITAGGTGKTPLVILICEKLAGRGKRVCVLTRGYGRSDPKKRVLVSDGKGPLVDARTGGDEPVEMARRLGGTAIIVADPNRVAAAKWAKEKFGVNAFVLDDAFQHRRAKRDVDIVCIDAMNAFGGGRMLPAGRLREPLTGLRRASAIVLTRADLAQNIDDIKAEIVRYNSSCPIFTSSNRMVEMTLVSKFLLSRDRSEAADTNIDYARLANTSAFAFCALGNPDSFFGQLRRDNFEVAGTESFADHHAYSQNDIASVTKKARDSGAGYLLTTAKDAVKLSGIEFEIPCFVLKTKLVIDDDVGFSALL
ncbi:MAG: tetraacyldisaccharide 4'-kinase [Acidobacteriota bacterium]